MPKVPRIGVGVIIRKGTKVLLLKRKGSHGDGSWAFIGGNLEFNESPEQCAIREVLEEIGITIRNPRAATFTNDLFPLERKHYITIYVVTEYSGEPIAIKEPHKIESVEWFEWNQLPSPLFIPLQNLLKTNFNPFKLP